MNLPADAPPPDDVPRAQPWPSYYPDPFAPPPPPPPSLGRELLAALPALLGVALAGALLGWAWSAITPTIPLRVGQEGGLLYITAEPEQPIAADGWFTILGFAFGLLAAVAVWLLLRRWHGPVQLVGLVLGAVAAGWIAHRVGLEIATAAYESRYADPAPGTIVQHPADLRAVTEIVIGGTTVALRGALLVPALAATLGYALMAGWSRWPSLRAHEERDAVAHSITES